VGAATGERPMPRIQEDDQDRSHPPFHCNIQAWSAPVQNAKNQRHEDGYSELHPKDKLPRRIAPG